MTKHSILLFLILISFSACSDRLKLENRREEITIDLINELNTDSLQSYVEWMQNMGTRFCLAENRREVAIDLRDKLGGFGYDNARLDSFLLEVRYRGVDYSLWQYNVIAVLEGTVYPDSLSVLGGHYDSILSGTDSDPFSAAPGAHDNASGIAAMLETARVMKDNEFEPEGSVVFIAFGAEELGLHGSAYYCRQAALSSAKIKLMLNNDMIAYETGTDEYDWWVNVMDYDNSGSLLAEAESLASGYTSLNTYNDNELNRYSDSYSFSRYGYPSLFFFKDDHDPNYHSLNDRTENCNFDYCREVTAICVALLVKKNIYKPGD
ncbi:MAG TPA: M20/M25/M40 family metallo-hydrolase [Bacteroidales bacterium]|nr:M20/M25/M40 family metallo-hydrolase [Bacteroidales bacterium]